MRVAVGGGEILEWALFLVVRWIDEREFENNRTWSAIGDFSARDRCLAIVGDTLGALFKEAERQGSFSIAQHKRVFDAIPARCVS